MQKIKTALLSFGMSGRVFHAPFIFQHHGFELYGVWERTAEKAKELYPQIKSFVSLEDLLADDNIELVVVNTPSVTHFEYTKKVLEAGKNVVVEKPFTATVSEAIQLEQLAGKYNKQLSVYHNRRYDSDFLTVKKMLSSAVLGDLKEVTVRYDRFTPALSPKPHKEAPTPAVGIVYDLGSHLIDSALQLFGMPVAVFADILTMREKSLVDDYFELLLYYPGFRVRLQASFFAAAPQGFIIHGSKGSFVKSRSDIQEAALINGAIPGTENWGREPEAAWGTLYLNNSQTKIPSETGNYGTYYEGIFQSLCNKQPLPVTAAEARNVIRVIEAAYQSSTDKMQVLL